MPETAIAVSLAILLALTVVVYYLLDTLHESQWNARVKYIFNDSAKIASDTLQTMWKP